MTKIVHVAEINIDEGLDGSLDRLIAKLTALREEAAAAHLTNVRVYTDYDDIDEGNVREWKMYIMGDERLPYKATIPPEQYERIFQMGVTAAKAGLLSISPFSPETRNDPCNEAWFAGYNSVKV